VGSFSINSIASNPIPVASTTPVTGMESYPTMARLNEIKNMDKSKLTKAERRELRKEVRAIKDSRKANGGGVYISAGAIIIILLLLIILL
jgi:hypothetical protein